MKKKKFYWKKPDKFEDEDKYPIVVYFDGACADNPHGHTACGIYIEIKLEGMRTVNLSRYIGVGKQMSNNVGEWSGLIHALKFLMQEGLNEKIILFRGDSNMVVMQANRKWGARRDKLYFPYYIEGMKLLKQFPNFVIEWIPREMNTIADDLSKDPLRERGIDITY